jgi:hypothetical protein
VANLETDTTATDQARAAVERPAELWQLSSRSLTERGGALCQLPQFDAVTVGTPR